MLFGQTIQPSKAPQAIWLDSLQLELNGMPKLTPFNSLDKLQPRYEYLWIFNDGQFIVGTPDSSVRHRFALPNPVTQKANGTSYPTGLYSDTGDRPPKIVVSNDIPIPTVTNGDPLQAQQTIEDPSSFLRLEKNHTNLVPDDTTVWILSFRNIFKAGTLNGNLFLFHDSPIEQIYTNPETKEEIRSISMDKDGKTQFGEFDFERMLLYFDNIENNTYSIDSLLSSGVNSKYKRALIWNFEELAPGAEKRLFLQFHNDTALLDKFPAELEGATHFLAMFVALETGNNPVGLSDEDRQLVDELGLQGFLDSIEIHQNQVPPSTDDLIVTTPYAFMERPTGNIIVDLMEVETRLSKAHDPNHMRIDACGCPEEGAGAQMLVATVDFVNDGNARTENIFVTIAIPEEVNFNSISGTPVSFFPPLNPLALNADVVLTMDEASREITWEFRSFSLNTTQVKGVGHPDTKGQIVFTMLTNEGVDIKDVPAMQACINFYDNAEDEVCTVPATPNIVTESDGNSILECSACRLPPAPVTGIPWWIWLIILLALGIVAWAVWENQ